MSAEHLKQAKQSIRRELRKRRRETSNAFRNQAAAKIAATLWRSRLLIRRRSLAVYLAVAGEVDCAQIIAGARLRKMRIFVPVLHGKRLKFAHLDKAAKLRKNRFKIAEPVVSRAHMRAAKNLDAVIVPLVGFDSSGNRLGMGGGFYDRSFALRARRRIWRKPLLIGVAYSFQQIDNIPNTFWDVPLDIVITEQQLLKNL